MADLNQPTLGSVIFADIEKNGQPLRGTKAKRDALASEIRQRGIRRREFERFITTLESLPDEVTDFSEDLWGSLVEYLTVYAKDDLRFMLPCEVEITA